MPPVFEGVFWNDCLTFGDHFFPQLLMAEMMAGPSSAISYPSGTARRWSDHQNCGGVGGNVSELMPSHIPLFTVTLPTASSFTVQMVS